MSTSTQRPLVVNMISESEFTVQGHGVHTAYKEITGALERRQDVDVAVNTNRPADIVHVQTVGMYALGRLFRRNAKKRVISAHLVPDSFIGSLRAAEYWRPIGKLWLRFFYKRADLVLACSGMVRDELVNEMKIPHVAVLYNTIDMSRYRSTASERQAARRALGLKKTDFVIIGNGQVQPRKRFDTFIAMARAMPDATFFWVGGIPFKHLGAAYEKMQKLVNTVPANVTVTGVIPLEEVRQYYLAADVFVLPATQENHPMCVLEAAGAGLPIILRDIPQYDDTFRGAALMASEDEEFVALAQRLRSDAAFRKEACRGSAVIAQRFDSATGAEQVTAFYRQLLEDRAS